MSVRRENRMAVVQFLYMWEINPSEDLAKELLRFFSEYDQPRGYFDFAEELIHGVLQRLESVDSEIKVYAQNWSFGRIAKIDLAILRMAIFELLNRSDIPPVVSINEAIELSKVFSNEDAKRFINGILDKVAEKLQRPLRQPAVD